MGIQFGKLFSGTGVAVDYLPETDKYIFSSNQNKKKIALIGCGIMGQEHMRVSAALGKAVIHGIYDKNPQSIQVALREYKKLVPTVEPKIYSSIQEACTDDIDIVFICTPNYTHYEVLKEVIKYNKPIFLEKPMATTLEQAFEITQIAKNYPTVFQIGLQARHKALYTTAKEEILINQSIGMVKTIQILEHRIPFLDKVGQWNKFNRTSGGTILEKSCHSIDLLNFFAQSEPVRVFGIGSQAVAYKDFNYQGKQSNILDNAHIVIEYANNVHASYDLCMFVPVNRGEITVCGDQGRFYGIESDDYCGNHEARMELDCGGAKPSKKCHIHYPEIIEKLGHGGATFFEHENLMDWLDGNHHTEAATPQECWTATVLSMAAEKAVATKKIIEISTFLKEHKLPTLQEV